MATRGRCSVQGSEGAKTAQKWVTAWPKPHTTYDAPTLALRVCTYLGMELTVLSAPWQPSSRRQEAPTAGTVAQPSSARALPRPPTGPLLPPPQAPVAAQISHVGTSAA